MRIKGFACFLLLFCCACSFPIQANGTVVTNHVSNSPDATLTQTSVQNPEVTEIAVNHPAVSATPGFTKTALIPTMTASAEVTVTNEPEMERPVYSINAVVDYALHSVWVDQLIEFRLEEDLQEIPLIVEMNRQPGFQLDAVNCSRACSGELSESILNVKFENTLPANQKSWISLQYILTVPEGPAYYGWSEKQLNLCDWYVMFPAKRADDTWWINHPGDAGEYMVYGLADISVFVSLIGEESDIEVIAPVPAQTSDRGYLFEKKNARNLVISISKQFEKLETVSENIKLQTWVYPEHINSGWLALECISEAIPIYLESFGTPELDQLVLVETDFPDGMEYDGLFFLNEDYFEWYGGTKRSGACALSVHETAHQWWYRLLASDQAYEPWVDESLTIFSEWLYYQNMSAEMGDWWKNYRIAPFDPQGWVDDDIYHFSSYRQYVNAVYLRGAEFWLEVWETAGQEAVLEMLQNYVNDNRFEFVSARDLISRLITLDEEKIPLIMERYFHNQ